IDGVELEGTWRPIDPLTINAQYSYLDAVVTNMNGNCVVDSSDPKATLPGANTSGCKPGGGQNIVGERLPEAPQNKVSINGQYAFRLDPGTLTLSASFIWKDATYGSIFNRALSLAPSYSLVNLRAAFDDAKGRYTLIAFANNVFDQTGFDQVTKANVAQSGFPLQLVSSRGLTPPLTFGMEVQFRFH